MKRVHWPCAVMSTLVGSCASTSAHYYTLLKDPGRSTPANVAMPVRLEVGRIPAQADRAELVIRLSDRRMRIVDGERWIAPLADEVQSALSVELFRRLGTIRPAESMGPDSLSVRLNVERFESSPGRYALIEASWRLAEKARGKDVLAACRTRAYEEVGGSYPELVTGYQRAIAAIADDIATVAQQSMRGLAAQCPGLSAQGQQ